MWTNVCFLYVLKPVYWYLNSFFVNGCCSRSFKFSFLSFSCWCQNTLFWLTSGSCKKSNTTSKGTPPNGKESSLIAYKAWSKYLYVLCCIIDISSIIKSLKCCYLFFNTWRVLSLGFLLPLDFNPHLTGRWNVECNAMPLKPEEAFPVHAFIRTDASIRFDLAISGLFLRTRLLKNFFQLQVLYLKIIEMVWVVTHYSFQIICNALHTAL